VNPARLALARAIAGPWLIEKLAHFDRR